MKKTAPTLALLAGLVSACSLPEGLIALIRPATAPPATPAPGGGIAPVINVRTATPSPLPTTVTVIGDDATPRPEPTTRRTATGCSLPVYTPRPGQIDVSPLFPEPTPYPATGSRLVEPASGDVVIVGGNGDGPPGNAIVRGWKSLVMKLDFITPSMSSGIGVPVVRLNVKSAEGSAQYRRELWNVKLGEAVGTETLPGNFLGELPASTRAPDDPVWDTTAGDRSFPRVVRIGFIDFTSYQIVADTQCLEVGDRVTLSIVDVLTAGTQRVRLQKPIVSHELVVRQ